MDEIVSILRLMGYREDNTFTYKEGNNLLVVNVSQMFFQSCNDIDYHRLLMISKDGRVLLDRYYCVDHNESMDELVNDFKIRINFL